MTTALTFRGAIIFTSVAAIALISRSERPTASDISDLGDEPWRGGFMGSLRGSHKHCKGWNKDWMLQGHPSPGAFGIPGRASMAASPGGTDPLQGRRTWATSFTRNIKPSERSRDIRATAPWRGAQDKVEGSELAALKLLA